MKHLTRIMSTLALLAAATTAHALATYSLDSDGDGMVEQDFQATPAYMATMIYDRVVTTGHTDATITQDAKTHDWLVVWVVSSGGTRTVYDCVWCGSLTGGSFVVGRREYVTTITTDPYALIAWGRTAYELADVTVVINACLK